MVVFCGVGMQDAARQKKALSEEAEKQTREFDAALEKETGTEIQKIREDLAREKDARINELRTETEDQLSRLDAYYESLFRICSIVPSLFGYCL